MNCISVWVVPRAPVVKALYLSARETGTAASAASAASADGKPKKRKRALPRSGSKKMRSDADSLIGRRVLRYFRRFGWFYGTVARPGA